MKKILTSFALVAASLAFAQVGINVGDSDTNEIAPDAVFHVKNKGNEKKGVIMPSVSLTSATDKSTTSNGTNQVTTGLMVWNDGTAGLTPAGYYYWDGAKWLLTGNVDSGSAGADNSIYIADGTLTGNRTVTQDNNDLKFTTGTGALEIDGTSKLIGGSYVKVTKVEGTSYNVTPDDYYIAVDGPTNEVFINLPEPSDNKGRVLIISNTTSQNVALNLNGVQAIYGTGAPSIAKEQAEWIVSDGKRWFNLINY